MISRIFSVFLIAITASAATYSIQTVAGSDFVGDGGLATQAALGQAEGLAIDHQGNLYVADAEESRVRRIAPTGVIQTVAGTGVAGFSGDNGPGTSAQLNHPYGLALDTAGNLYIADLGNARVRKLSPAGQISTYAGGGSTVAGSAGDGSQALTMQLNAPRNVAIDASGNLYISDFGANQVYQVSPAGILTTLAGSGKAGFSGDNGAAMLAQLNSPAGLAIDAFGNVYIADSGNGRVRKVQNGVISTVFNIAGPTGLYMASSGALYVASAGYFGTLSQPVGKGIAALDVTGDSAGNLYVVGNGLVQKISAAGAITVVAGTGAPPNFGGDGGPANMARLNAPLGVAVDDLGDVYIADSLNNRIRKISPAGTISTFAGTGQSGSTVGTGPAVQAQLNTPGGVGVDSLRNLYVADTGNNRVCKITPGGAITVLPATGLKAPQAVVVDAGGNVYIADTGNNQIVELTPAGRQTVIAQALKPAALALDSTGTLYVSEANRISKIGTSGILTTVLDGVNQPGGIALLATGDLVFTVTSANVVRLLSASGTVSTIAGTGAAGFTGDGGEALAATLNAPVGIALDSSGVLWVADTANNRLRTLTADASPAVQQPQMTLVNSASLQPGAVAPGEIVTLFGTGFDPNNTQVLFDGAPATIFYTRTGQMNLLAPATLQPGRPTSITVQVDNALSGALTQPVVAVAPALFTTGNGTGQAAAVNQDGSLNSSSNPAPRGSIVNLYGTGFGTASTTVTATVGAYSAGVLYAGPAPGFPGLEQVNLQIPAGFLAPGNQPVVVTVGNTPTQAGVTIALN